MMKQQNNDMSAKVQFLYSDKTPWEKEDVIEVEDLTSSQCFSK